MNWADAALVPLIARICLVVLFPFSAYDKFAHWSEAIKQADSSFLPHWSGPPLLVISMIVEVLAPICIVIGWHDRIAALVLAAFCIVTALLYHPFWKFADFWSRDGKGRAHFWDFLKNFGLVGGLLLVVMSGVPVSASQAIHHPLSSAPVSASTTGTQP